MFCSLCLEYYTRSGSVITVFWCTHILVYVLCQLDWNPFLIIIIFIGITQLNKSWINVYAAVQENCGCVDDPTIMAVIMYIGLQINSMQLVHKSIQCMNPNTHTAWHRDVCTCRVRLSRINVEKYIYSLHLISTAVRFCPAGLSVHRCNISITLVGYNHAYSTQW